MSETANTANLASKVSDEICQWLKWQHNLAQDMDFECSNVNHEKTTHPTDVVFYYKNPYTDKTVYLNTDLKSYKKSSITPTSIRSSLRSLAMTIECAMVSATWQAHFTTDSEYDIYGLLFVFNYDGSFMADFNDSILKKIDTNNLNIPKGQPIAIFEPKTIQYLLNVVDDLKEQLRNRDLRKPSDYDFYYPNLITAKTHSLNSYPATIETVLSPFMIVKFKNEHQNEYVVYYQEKGTTVDEFTYLIDTLGNHQLLGNNNKIQIVLNPFHNNQCLAKFNSAKRSYAELWGMEIDDDFFRNLTVKTLNLKNHYYDPLNERMTDEQH